MKINSVSFADLVQNKKFGRGFWPSKAVTLGLRSRSTGPRHRLYVKSASRQRKLRRMRSGIQRLQAAIAALGDSGGIAQARASVLPQERVDSCKLFLERAKGVLMSVVLMKVFLKKVFLMTLVF